MALSTIQKHTLLANLEVYWLFITTSRFSVVVASPKNRFGHMKYFLSRYSKTQMLFHIQRQYNSKTD